MSELEDAIERLEFWARGEEFDELTVVIAAARERDALASVIEEALAIPHGHFGPWDDDVCDYEQLAAILSRTPSDVLVERDARIRAEVIDYLENWGLAYPEDAVEAARGHFGLTKGADRD